MSKILPRLKNRELVLLATIALSVLALGWTMARDLRQSAEDASRLYLRLAHGLDLINELQFNTQEVRRILLYALHTSDANRQLEYAEQSRAVDVRVQRLLDDASAAVLEPQALGHLRSVRSAWHEYLLVRDEVIGLILERSLAEGVALDEDLGTARFNAVRVAMSELKQSLESDAVLQVAAARAGAVRALKRLGLLVAIVLVAVALGIYLVNRRAALEGLLRIEAHKGSILQSVPDPVISTDDQGRIVELNHAAERVFGFTRADVLGLPLDDAILPPAARGVLAMLAGMLAGVQDTSPVTWPRLETVAVRRDGTEFPVELAVVTHTVGRDRVWTLHVSDLTARRRAEEQLRGAKEAAENADRVKSDFLATMSHEVRTPLSAVIGIADLLQTADVPPAQGDLLRMLRSSATSLMALVNDILDYSRIEANLMDLVPAPFTLHACIEGALDGVTQQAWRKGLALGYVMAPDVPPTLVADQERVRQVLLNLLSNAVKFTSAGEVGVRVTARPLGEREVVVAISVRDTGRGIPRHLRADLFQRFRQLHSPTGTSEGTGLGLAIAERLSRLLGGSLRVESEPGQGSTFIFEFTARRATAAPDPSDGAALSGLRVLARLGAGIVGEQVRSLVLRWGASFSEAGGQTPDRADLAGRFDVMVVDAEHARDVLEPQGGEPGSHSSSPRLPVVVIARRMSEPGLRLEARDRVIAMPVRINAFHDVLCAAAGVAPPSATGEAAPMPGLSTPAPLAILLVEDNAPNRRVVRLMIEEIGFEVDEASSGAEAVDCARRRAYDVILMDVQMPDLNGLEATRRIRRHQGAKAPTIIALTANVMEGEEARCRDAGMDLYLTKPIRLDTLATTLARLASSSNPAVR